MTLSIERIKQNGVIVGTVYTPNCKRRLCSLRSYSSGLCEYHLNQKGGLVK